jgi:hypothetical protein
MPAGDLRERTVDTLALVAIHRALRMTRKDIDP